MTSNGEQAGEAGRMGLGALELVEGRAWRNAHPGRDLGAFHLAHCGGRLCLFHRGGLALSEPAAWAALQAIAHRLDAALVVDRRERAAAVAHDRRRATLALTVAAGLFARTAMAGDGHGEAAPAHVRPPAAVELTLAPGTGSPPDLSLPAVRGGVRERQFVRDAEGRVRIGRVALAEPRRVTGSFGLGGCAATAAAQTSPCLDGQFDPVAAARIESLLVLRLGQAPDASMRGTLAEVARYYARHAEVVRLFDALAHHPWTLKPRAETWLTEAKMRNGAVHRITVLFDFNTAAQMHFAQGCEGQPACTAMPADAFLHELLHVYVIHAEPGAFARAATGGFYPHAHEEEVIALENRLYRAMEARDGLPRPARESHAGKLTEVDCPLCWASREAADREGQRAL